LLNIIWRLWSLSWHGQLDCWLPLGTSEWVMAFCTDHHSASHIPISHVTNCVMCIPCVLPLLIPWPATEHFSEPLLSTMCCQNVSKFLSSSIPLRFLNSHFARDFPLKFHCLASSL
jgi:hypothetical protein